MPSFYLLRRIAGVPGKLIFCGLLLPGLLYAAAAPTATALQVAENTPQVRQLETLTATVTASGVAVTGGTVTFLDGTSVLGTVQVVRAGSGGFTIGTATLKTMGLAAGGHSLTARYDGDASDAASTSAAQAVTVTGLSETWTTLGSSGPAGQTALTATVAGAGPAGLSGNVVFTDHTAGSTLATAAVNPATQQTFLSRSAAATTGAGPVAMAVADLNGDGLPDAVTVNPLDDTVSVLLADGHGGLAVKSSFTTYSPATTYPYPVTPEAVAVWDFNGDGRPDFVVITTGSIAVYLGDGKGGFSEGWNEYMMTEGGPMSVAVGDFNGDGTPDLVFAMGTGVTMLPGDGAGGFAASAAVLVASAGGQWPGINRVLAADFNHDGHLDVAMLNLGAGTLEIALNDGSGHFTLQPAIAVGKTPDALVAADWNGDGKTDLAIANQSTNVVQIWMNNGDGTFTAGATVAVGQGPAALAAADFDGDGVADLAVANQNDNTVTLLRGDGAGGFSVLGTFGVDLSPIALSVADANGDSRPDLLVATQRGDSIDVLLNENRAAATLASVTIPGSGIDAITAAYQGDAAHAPSAPSNAVDVNATLIPVTLALGLQPATGVVSGEFVRLTATVSPNAQSGVAATGTVKFLDGSNALGTAPLVAGGTAELLTANLATGTHSFTATYSGDDHFAASQTAAPVSLQVGTATAVTSSATTTTLTVGTSSLAPGTPVTLTATVSAGGGVVTDGTVSFLDGTTVLGTAQVVSNSVAGLTVGTATWRTNGLGMGSHALTAQYNGDRAHAGSHSSSQTITVSGQYTALVAGVSGSAETGTASWLNGTVEAFGLTTPSGTVQWVDETASHSVLFSHTVQPLPFLPDFLDLANPSVGNGPVAVETADFNGDGFPDFVVVNRYSNTLSILLGDGKGGLQLHSTPPVGNGPVAVAVADFDGDGVMDLAVVNGADNTVSLLRGDGQGGFTTYAVIPVGQTPTAVAVGDLNDDGYADLAVTSRGENTVTVLLGNGTGKFAKVSATPTGKNPEGVAIADFTRDGNPDLAVANADDNTVSLLAGDGAGNFKLNSTYKTDLSPGGLTVGDVNLDGLPDLAIACAGGARVDMLLGTAAGGLVPGAGAGTDPIVPGTPPGRVVIADFNGDGHPDLAMSDYFGLYVSFNVFAGDGAGHWTEMGGGISHITIDGFSGLAVADVNGDGRADAVVVNELSNQAMIYAGYLRDTVQDSVTVPGGGNHNVALTYSGDATYTAAQSDAVSVAATPISTQTAVAASPSTGIAPGQTVTITATVTPSLINGMTASGTVSFSEDGAAIGTAALKADGTASLVTAALPAGAHRFTASYGGDTNYVASVTSNSAVVWVQGSSSVQLTANQSTLTPGGIETLTAAVTQGSQAATGGTVVFFDGTQVLGKAPVTASGSAVLKTAALAAGSHAITAQYTGNNAAAASLSNSVTVTVSGQYSSGVSLKTQGWNGSYTLMATVSGAGPVPTGTVTFTDDTTQKEIGNAPLVASSASIAMEKATPVLLPNVGVGQVVGDWNGDGYPDLAIAAQKVKEVEIWLGKGDGSFTEAGSLSLSAQAVAIVTGDFNGDGKADLAVGIQADPALLIYLGDGKGGFTLASSPAVHDAAVMVVADFNGDGHADLAVGDSYGNASQILLGDGTGNFTVAGSTGGAPGYGGVAVADFNGDGKPDLAYSSYFDNAVDIYLGHGDGNFSKQSSPAAGKGPEWIVTRDFNGDGKADLAVGDRDDKTVTVLWGDGSGHFTAGPVLKTSSYVTGLIAGDFNGDGYSDLAATSQYGNTMNVFLGDGKGAFTPVAMNLGMELTGRIVSAAFNPDAMTDVAMLDNNGNLQMWFSENAALATLSNVALPGDGSHSVTASYGGDSNYTASQPSTAVALDGGKVSPAVTLSASVNPVAYGQAEALTVTVAGKSGAGTPTGTVTLLADQTQVATVPLDAKGTAQWSTNVQSMKTHSYTATYAGDGNYAPSQTTSTLVVTVNDGPAAVALSASSPALTFGQPETLTAQVSSKADGGTPTGSVTFLDGATPVGTGSLDGHGTAVVSVATLGGGSHSLTAQYSGDAAYAAAHSAAAVVAVQPAPVTLTVTPSETTGAYGDSIALTAKATSGTGTPTGTVTFVQDGVTLGSADLDAQGTAALNTTKLPGGTDHITAGFGGSSNFAAATSEAVTVQLTPAADYQISSDTTTLTVHVGGTAAAKLTLTPVNGFDQTVGLNCGTLPAGVSCGFSPASLSLAAGSGTMTLTVSVAATAAAPTPFSGGAVPPAQLGWVLLFLLGSLLGVAGRGRMRRLAGVALMAAALAGCGGAPASSGPSPGSSITGTHSVTITAATTTADGSGGPAITHTVPITIVIQ